MRHFRSGSHGRRSDPRSGTASMEAILCLPFLVLILVLTLNLGHGWSKRIRAESAVRFAGTWLAYGSDSAQGSPAFRAGELVREHYFPEFLPQQIGSYGPEVSLEDLRWRLENRDSVIVFFLRYLGRAFSGRQNVTLDVILQAPTRTLLPTRAIRVDFALDKNTWTHGEKPLGFVGVRKLLGHERIPPPFDTLARAANVVLHGLFWFLGAEA